MAEITALRSGKFIRFVFKLLLDKTDGLPVKEILENIPQAIELTEFERGYYPSTPNYPRYIKIVRFATIPFVKAGWLVKNKGRWFITEEGRQAYQKISDDEKFYKAAYNHYQEWRESRVMEEGIEAEIVDESTKISLSLEEVEELAQEQIQLSISNINPYEFQDMVADLLRAMGYYIYWIAPPGKDRGIDVIAYQDAIGATGPRVKVQVKHRPDHPIPVEPLRAFMSVVGVDEIGLFVSTGGFTSDAKEESRSQDKRKITLLDLESFIELWTENYSKLTEEARQRFPLKPIYFPAPIE